MDILLYELDAAGETQFSEVLASNNRDEIRRLAQDRLERCHAIEVWEGPLCILRLRRKADPRSQAL